MKIVLVLFLYFISFISLKSANITGNESANKSTPDFGPTVIIFDPAMPMTTVQGKCDTVFKQQERSQFGKNRYALLFKPGTYTVDVNVGYYTHVIGLGMLPDDAQITGAVHAEGDWFRGNVTQNFWRACENLAIIPAEDNTNRWAVSQAAPFRRMHIKGNLVLHDGGWASGGFISDSKIDGRVNSGPQQQWYSRNSEFGEWRGNNWNMVFQGIINPPEGIWPDSAFTIIKKTPVIREKPFLYIDKSDNYFVFVSSLRKDAIGNSWSSGEPMGKSIPIDQFYIIHAGKDSAESINAALQQNKNLLFTPGIYYLGQSIKITRSGTIVLGLGIPTLIPENGNPVMEVADVDGVQIAGILFDAGAKESPTLLQIGEEGSKKDHSANPISLHDVFCRVGGMTAGMAATSLKINSNNVIGDHFWIWRADHGSGVGWEVNKALNGLVVNGNDVTIYSLFVEHYQEYQTLWNGNGGRCYFYQCELPYDPPDQSSWEHNGINGWAGYKVSDSVVSHEAWGLGVYAFLRHSGVNCSNAFEVPKTPAVSMHHLVSISFSRRGGEITNVINGVGEAANRSHNKSVLERYP